MSKEYLIFGFACLAIGFWQLIMRLVRVLAINDLTGIISLILCLIIIVVGFLFVVWGLADQ